MVNKFYLGSLGQLNPSLNGDFVLLVITFPFLCPFFSVSDFLACTLCVLFVVPHGFITSVSKTSLVMMNCVNHFISSTLQVSMTDLEREMHSNEKCTCTCRTSGKHIIFFLSCAN